MKAKKRFGQNFITDKNLLEKIVLVADIKGKNVLEIGPGRGALTSPLIRDSNKYLGYEIDLDLVNTLKTYQNPNAHFIFTDFLKADVLADLKHHFNDEEVHLVGNLPYYITSPIIFKFLDIPQIKSATIMVQKEVAQRMSAKKDTKNYNGLSVILQYFTDVELKVNVSKKLFKPIPQVDSAVVTLIKKQQPYDEAFTQLLIEVIKAAFAHKRKTLVNNLYEKYQLQKEDLIELLTSKNLPSNIRAENLSLEEFIGLTKALRPNLVNFS